MWEIIGMLVVGVVVGIIGNVLYDAMKRYLQYARDGIRMEAVLESGPVSREYGFTEKAVKITVANESGTKIGIQDIRLMFCGAYGAPVAPEAPPERSHPELPVSLDSGAMQDWYIPAEKLSGLLGTLHHNPSPTTTATVKLYPQCITATGKIYKGLAFEFSTDPNSHFP